MVEANAIIGALHRHRERQPPPDHCGLGALVVMRVWNLPPLLMAAVRLHHDQRARRQGCEPRRAPSLPPA